MPLINGKEVIFTQKQIIGVQQDINKIPQIPDELKQQLSPEEMKTILPAEGVDVSNIGFFSGQEEEGLRNRKERYDLYREMDQMVFIHRAIETVCDDGVQMNDEGHALKFFSDDDDLKDRLDDLFNNRLNFDSNLWSIMYETIKMGDNFFEVIPDSYERPKKIVKLRFLEPQRVERIEVNGKLAYFIYRQDLKDAKNKKIGDKEYRLQPWQIIHFKVDNKEFEPYGGSLLTAGVRTYRRLALLEDVMLVYRISRSPERRVFYVDVGQLSPIEAKRFLQKFRDSYRTQQFIDENGKINKRAQVLSVTSDIFIPVREGGQGTKIDTLEAGTALSSMDDLKYFRDEILRTLNIPPDYLGDQSDRCLHPDTKIKLADGREISIKQITEEYNAGKTNYVYSITENKEWKIKPIQWAGITDTNREMIKVNIDNGESIICTPNHRFMLRNGVYCEAKDLQPETSLMPIYTKISSKKNGDKLDGYEMLLNNETGEWEYTHRIAKQEELLEAKESKKTTVHHKNFNKLNNNPDNLQLMTSKTHWVYHARLAKRLSEDKELVERRNESIREYYSTEEGLEVGRKNMAKAQASPKKTAEKLRVHYSTIKRLVKKNGYKSWEYFKDQPINHKVLSVEIFGICEEVYDITIDNETPNFTVSSVLCHNSRGALSALDIKFSRYIERVQSYVESGLNKIAILDLFFAGKKRDELQDFMIELTPPSNIKELTDIEFFNQKIMLIGAIIQLNIFPTKWILKKIMRLTDKEIADIMLYKQLEDQQKAQQQAQQAGGAPGGMPMGGMTGPEGAMPPGAGEGAPPVEGMSGAEGGNGPATGSEAIPPPATAPVNAESLIQAFGQDFLVENQEDFFKLMKVANDYNDGKYSISEEAKEEASVLMEAISVVISGRPTTQKKKSKLSYLFSDNEFGGLGFNEGKEPDSIRVFKEKRKRRSRNGDEETVFEESTIYLQPKQ